MNSEKSTWDKKSIKTILGKGADFNELAKDCVAFANLKGGHLHIGIEDDNEFPSPEQKIDEFTAERVTKRLNELTINVGMNCQVCTAPNGGQYIDIEVFPSRSSVASTTSGKYFMRDNDESRPLLPDELLRLVGDKPSYCWETKTTSVRWQEADESKLHIFEQSIKHSDRVSEFVKEKTTSELLEHYLLTDEKGYLTNLGVLWIGKTSQRARLLYSPVVQYIRYNDQGEKVYKKVWDDYTLNPQELLESIWQSVPEWKESNEVSEGLWRKEIPAYDEKVVREALANALVHRPYTTRGDIFINIHPDYMEIVNPGRLPYGVTASTILHKTVQRNEHMSKIFHDLHLMEKEGSGFDLMYEVLLTWGKRVPFVKEGDDSVSISISRTIVDKEAYRLYEYLSDNYRLSQKSYISFGIILQDKKIKSADLFRKLQLTDNDKLKSYTRQLLEHHIILSHGLKKGTYYLVNPQIISNSKANIKTTLKTIEPYRLRALIEEDLRYHPESKLNEIAQRLPDVDYKELQKTVRTMALEGLLKHDESRKYRHYWLP
ncbi:MAG: putative DNA binding domain-containing protein [Bacteroidaceae bacterium]|nr:putative DNA binding domain-containing protein [Bacteroidaceae bacterium]